MTNIKNYGMPIMEVCMLSLLSLSGCSSNGSHTAITMANEATTEIKLVAEYRQARDEKALLALKAALAEIHWSINESDIQYIAIFKTGDEYEAIVKVETEPGLHKETTILTFAKLDNNGQWQQRTEEYTSVLGDCFYTFKPEEEPETD